MERIGIYGGTFNPVHWGHLRGAEYACEALGLDKLLMIPDRSAPHKQLPQGSADHRQRLEMLRLALDRHEKILPVDLVSSGDGPSYAFETVARVREQYPGAKLFLILGADMLETFPQWKHAGEILKEVTLAVLHRGDKEEARSVARGREALEVLGAEVIPLENPVTAISSTQLRRMLVFQCASEFLPERVERYIRDNALYGTGNSYRDLTIDQLEQVVVSLLKPSRVAHVLGCRQAAVTLAERYGADCTDAARAALLHDITKALDGPLQLTLCREYGTMLDAFSTKNPKTLHALTGSLVAERIFGENPAVVDAIRCHTTGKPNMNVLEKIIYVADYMEPNRDFPGVEKLRALAYEDITHALELGLQMTLDVLKTQGREISPESQEALRYLKAGS